MSQMQLRRIARKILGGAPVIVQAEDSDQFYTYAEDEVALVLSYPSGAEIARNTDTSYGRWRLEIDREEWNTDDLTELEVILAGWYADEYGKSPSEILDIVKAELLREVE